MGLKAKDILGNELEVGDRVVYVTDTKNYSDLNIGVIDKVNPKTVIVSGKRRGLEKVAKIDKGGCISNALEQLKGGSK